MTIDELIDELTEAKKEGGYVGSEPVYVWNDGDWTDIKMVDPGRGHIDLNIYPEKLEKIRSTKEEE